MHSSEAKHRKHAKLSKPEWGTFGKHEIALMGAPCSSLRALATELLSALGGRLKCAWLDAFHPEDQTPHKIEMHRDTQGNTRITIDQELSPHEVRPLLSGFDLVLLNGNHFTASKQILLLDPAKQESVKRKLDRLTNPLCFLATPEVRTPYAFVKAQFPEWEKVPLIDVDNIAGQVRFLSDHLDNPHVYGLILAGGKSSRMGKDKAFLEFGERPQYLHLAHKLKDQCEHVFISCRKDQQDLFTEDFPLLFDKFEELGPYGAILTAFQHCPDVAWLVVACDLPLVSKETLQQLLEERNSTRIATAFYNAETGLPDPLITLWEPKAYPRLLYFLSQGYSCPRKALINSDSEVINPKDPAWLKNVNTPDDLHTIRGILAG